MENRDGLIMDARLTRATGTAAPSAALDMLGQLRAAGGKTVGAARKLGVTSHVAQNITAFRGFSIDGRKTRHDGYRVSKIIRKRIEEANGWIKEVGGMAQTKFRGLARVGWMFTLKATAYNLIRLPKMLPTG